jgi:probable biosynthetic protein (TIGR04098 family)
MRTPTFGDRLEVASTVTGAGPQSALTIHRVQRNSAPGELAFADFWAPPPEGELRVEHLNRWITPLGESNTELVSTIPVGFDPATVPPLPAECSPRGRIRRARDSGSFRSGGLPAMGEVCHLSHAVDAARDLNAVGLMYFAAVVGVVDWALWQAWRTWGRSDADFLRRVVLDQELLYQGNADAGALLDIEVRRCTDEAEVVDVVITRGQEGAPMCVCTLTLQPQEVA